MPRRAIVLLELHHACLGEVLLEVEDVLDVRAAPAVDRLVVIAHDHKVLVLRGKQVRDLVLDVVRVLVLVHADVAEALLVLLEHLRTGAQQLERSHQKVVEVHGVRRAKASLELEVHLRGLLLGRRVRLAHELLRPHHGVFRRADLRENHVERELLLLDAQSLHDVAHQAARIVIVIDGELPGVAQKVRILAEHAHAHGVERAHPHAARAVRQQRLQALAHLGRRLVGERDGEHAPRAHVQIRHDVRDAVGEHARLARPGTGEHQERPLGGEHRLLLSGVERIDIYGVAGHTSSEHVFEKACIAMRVKPV